MPLSTFAFMYRVVFSTVLVQVITIFFAPKACIAITNDLPIDQYPFYIYDWPSHLQSSWPSPDAKLYHGKNDNYERYQTDNFGAGTEIDEYIGMYKSNPFQLYTIIMSKLRIHPRRTFNRKQAKLFIVPYDIGISNQYKKENGMYTLHSGNDCPESSEVLKLLREEIGNSTLGGHDHLLINSMQHMFGRRCQQILEACANCTVIASDVSNHKDHPMYKEFVANNRPFPRRWYSVPFISTYHWTETAVKHPWEVAHRPPSAFFVSMWAHTAVQQPPASKLRKALVKQCDDRPAECYNLHVQSRHQNKCLRSGVGNCIADVGNMTGIEAYNSSVFCMQPPGDLMSRKGVFDSFLSGCIPVLFNSRMLSKNYPWFFPADGQLEGNTTAHISHYYKVDPKFNVVDALRKQYPPERIRSMQRLIEELGPRLQYAVPPSRFAPYIGHAGGPGNISSPAQGLGGPDAVWKPPFRDAVDVILDALAGIAQRFARTGVVPPEEAPNGSQDQWTAYWRDG